MCEWVNELVSTVLDDGQSCCRSSEITLLGSSGSLNVQLGLSHIRTLASQCACFNPFYNTFFLLSQVLPFPTAAHKS